MDGRCLIERLFEAESRGDVEGIVSTMCDDVVLELTCRRLYATDAQTTFHGKDAARRVYAQDVKTRGASFRIEPTYILEAGDRVAAEWIARRGEDHRTIRRGVDVFRIRDGLIAQGTVYLDLTTVPELDPQSR